MDLGQTFSGVMNFARENPALFGIMTTIGVFMFLSTFSGNRGLFNNLGNAATAGGTGLAVSLASSLLGGNGLGGMIPDWAADMIPGLEPDAT